MPDTLSQVETILARGESIQLVALPGMGKSRLAKQIPGFYFDTNCLPSHDHVTALKLLAALLEVNPIPNDNTELFLKISEKILGLDTVIIIDYMNPLLSPELKPFFTILKALRDRSKYLLKYVFTVQGATPLSHSYFNLLGDLYEIFSENIIILNPIPQTQFAQKIKSDFSTNLAFNPSDPQIDTLYQLSGGIPALVKISMQAMRDNKKLDPESHPRLKAQLEEIRVVLGDNPDSEILTKHGLVDQNRQIKSQLLREYLQKFSPSRLSAAETHLLELLISHSGNIVSKDQICESVYPDVKNKAGISDHAIDQLIHRLREKIQHQYSLTTHRGLGYKLTPS
jgi:hypothetical protein